jgi:choice-of-anchor B domain-containing protein
MSLLFLLPLVSVGQASLNTTLLYHWQDTTLPGSSMYSNVYNEVWGMVINDREIAVIGSTNGTHFFDVTDPANVVELDFVPGAAQGVQIVHRDYHDYQGYLYIVCDEGASTLQIVDVSDLPDSVTLVYDSDSLLTRAHNIFIDTASGHLYSCAEKSGTNKALHIYDLADPENPTHHYIYNDVGHVHDAYVENDTAFLNCGNEGLRIVDFSMVGPSLTTVHNELTSLTVYPDAGYNHSGWPTADWNYYVMADENHGHKMKMIDVSDFSNPTVVATFFSAIDSNQSMAHNQIIKGDYVYTAHYHDGLYVHDISDPMNPSLQAYYDTFDPAHHNSYMGAWGVYPFLPSGNILVSDMQTGLYVFSVDHNAPVGVEDLSKAITVYPNPVQDQLHIRTLYEGEKRVVITNLQGQKLMEQAVDGSESIDVSTLSAGVYLLSLEAEGQLVHKKIFKQ